jgi:hypothetical protein
MVVVVCWYAGGDLLLDEFHSRFHSLIVAEALQKDCIEARSDSRS